MLENRKSYSMRYYNLSVILVCLFLVYGCSAGAGKKGIATADAEWIKETNFKQDFVNDLGAKIENIKGNQTLMKYVLDAVEAGEMPAYDYDTQETLNAAQIKQVFYPVDTVITYDYDSGIESGEEAVQGELNRSAVNRFRVKQEWYFDKETMRLESRVKGLAPLETIYNEDETERGDLPLFWVLFE